MRSFATLIVTLVLCSTTSVQAATDLSPIGCAWDKLPVAEQARLRDEFKVALKDASFDIIFANPDAALASDAAGQCQLNITPAQTEHLALGLARRAAEEKAKKGIADRGENPASIQTTLAKMHEGKREMIGDTLACPGPHAMVHEWDESLKGAARRANLRFKDGRAYSFVFLALYAIMAQEGSMRRMSGAAGAC